MGADASHNRRQYSFTSGGITGVVSPTPRMKCSAEQAHQNASVTQRSACAQETWSGSHQGVGGKLTAVRGCSRSRPANPRAHELPRGERARSPLAKRTSRPLTCHSKQRRGNTIALPWMVTPLTTISPLGVTASTTLAPSCQATMSALLRACCHSGAVAW